MSKTEKGQEEVLVASFMATCYTIIFDRELQSCGWQSEAFDTQGEADGALERHFKDEHAGVIDLKGNVFEVSLIKKAKK
jgi:hypothetical protein